jgi:hypothetical protein
LHGQLAPLRLPDPNWFGGDLMIVGKDQDWRSIRTDEKTFGVKNWPVAAPKFANNRGLGLADMARAIIDQRPHRANGEIALHVLAGDSRGGHRRSAICNFVSMRAAHSFAGEGGQRIAKARTASNLANDLGLRGGLKGDVGTRPLSSSCAVSKPLAVP